MLATEDENASIKEQAHEIQAENELLHEQLNGNTEEEETTAEEEAKAAEQPSTSAQPGNAQPAPAYQPFKPAESPSGAKSESQHGIGAAGGQPVASQIKKEVETANTF